MLLFFFNSSVFLLCRWKMPQIRKRDVQSSFTSHNVAMYSVPKAETKPTTSLWTL